MRLILGISFMQKNTVPLGLVIGFCRSPSDVIRTRLTKKFFLTIPAGYCVESNITQNYIPLYLEAVAVTVADRGEQWAKIVALELNNRLCNVYAHSNIKEILNATMRRMSEVLH